MVKPNQATVELSIKRIFTNLRRVVVDLGGAASAVLVYVGDKLGLYRAMSDAGNR